MKRNASIVFAFAFTVITTSPITAYAAESSQMIYEKQIKLTEEIATVVYDNKTNCDLMGDKLSKVLDDNAAFMKVVQVLTPEQRKQGEEKYKARGRAATAKMLDGFLRCHTNAKVNAVMEKLKALGSGPSKPDDTAPPMPDGSTATNVCRNFQASCVLLKDGRESCAEWAGDGNISLLERTCAAIEPERGGPGRFSRNGCSLVKAVGACQMQAAATGACSRSWFYPPFTNVEVQKMCAMTDRVFVSP